MFDPLTGLYYLKARDYDPSLRSFIQADSYAFNNQGLINGYFYGNNNPLMGVDPSGHKFNWKEALGVAGTVLASVFTGGLIGYGMGWSSHNDSAIFSKFMSKEEASAEEPPIIEVQSANNVSNQSEMDEGEYTEVDGIVHNYDDEASSEDEEEPPIIEVGSANNVSNQSEMDENEYQEVDGTLDNNNSTNDDDSEIGAEATANSNSMPLPINYSSYQEKYDTKNGRFFKYGEGTNAVNLVENYVMPSLSRVFSNMHPIAEDEKTFGFDIKYSYTILRISQIYESTMIVLSDGVYFTKWGMAERTAYNAMKTQISNDMKNVFILD
ncbi:RHS repeat-associated core domain-containing protein [Cysteiniphilum halobium]|uniref:RHS repeat-associated core domain-containing protein n=1 Tax=Cysteiniphilum halobium TaxID=2219059 RepID=UPI001F1977FC|nr:RHS repeat-associated core domain-containing protein [Cysteiniphilum halobium]